jgi:murein DD-endopeptidase MepM/ murein hydrolase activator NlpD
MRAFSALRGKLTGFRSEAHFDGLFRRSPVSSSFSASRSVGRQLRLGVGRGHTSLRWGASGRVRRETLLEETASFWKNFTLYIFRRFRSLINFSYRTVVSVFDFSSGLKLQLQGRLYRRKGQLSFPLAHASLLGISFSMLVFTSGFGEFLYLRTGALDLSDGAVIIAGKPSVATEESELLETEVQTYIVKAGDTLYDIAKKFRVTVDTLSSTNNIAYPYTIHPDQKLTVPPVPGLVYTVKAGDTLASVAEEYKVDDQDIVEFNYLFRPFKLKKGQRLIIPYAQVPQPEPVYTASSGSTSVTSGYLPSSTGACGSVSLSWPVASHSITRGWRWYHRAWDMAASYEPVYASGSGTVVTVGWQSWGYGYYIRVDHGGGWTTLYAHLSKHLVGIGQNVSKGQVIGTSGATGWATGPHLHFESRCNGHPVVPSAVLH